MGGADEVVGGRDEVVGGGDEVVRGGDEVAGGGDEVVGGGGRPAITCSDAKHHIRFQWNSETRHIYLLSNA